MARIRFLTIALAAALFSAAMLSPVFAGDKIRFSDPTDELSGPERPREEKSVSTSAFSPNGVSPGPMNFAPPQPIVIRRNDNRSKDKDWNSRDSSGNANDTTGNNTTMDSRWDARNSKWDNDSTSQTASTRGRNVSGGPRENDRSSRPDSEWNASGQNSRSSGRYTDSTAAERRAWSLRDAQSQSFSDLVGTGRTPIAEALRQEQVDRLSGFRALYQAPSSTAPVGSPAQTQNPLHDYTWQSPDTLPDGSAQKPQPEFAKPGFTPRYSSAPQPAVQSVFGQRLSTPTSLMPERGPIRAQPAVLSFPKRPGEL